MKICCAGYSAEMHVAIVLLINVISNIILLQNNSSEFLKLKAKDNELSWYLILIQTILSLFTIAVVMIFKNSASSIVIWNWIQVVLFGFIFALLAYEILGVILFAICSVYQERDFNDIWKITRKIKMNETVTTDFQIFVAIVSICYFAFKLHAATVTFVFAGEVAKYIKTDTRIDNEELNSGEDSIIINSLSTAPPTYDSCFMEIENMDWMHSHKLQTPPPSYATIFSFPAH